MYACTKTIAHPPPSVHGGVSRCKTACTARVITPLSPKGLEAQVPQPAHDAKPDPEYKIVVVQVLDGHQLKINEEPATWDNLGEQLDNIFKLRAEKVAFLKGDDTVLFAEVARAIDVMRSSGVEKVGLMTAGLEAGR